MDDPKERIVGSHKRKNTRVGNDTGIEPHKYAVLGNTWRCHVARVRFQSEFAGVRTMPASSMDAARCNHSQSKSAYSTFKRFRVVFARSWRQSLTTLLRLFRRLRCHRSTAL